MSVFFGMSMEPGLSYLHTLSKAVHITGVAIGQGQKAKVYVQIQMKKYIMATVSKAIPQAPLDLKFSKGDQVTFNAEGDATVSLLGYLQDIDSEDKDCTIEDMLKDGTKKNTNEKKAGAQSKDHEEEDGEDGGEEEDEEDDDDFRLIEDYKAFLKNEEEYDDDKDEDESDEEEDFDDSSVDEEEVEQPKAKVAKLSPETNAKKGAKEHNRIAKKEKEAKQPPPQKTKPEAKKQQPKANDQTFKQQQPTERERFTGGVKIADVIPGKGEEAKSGKRVAIYYIGRLLSNNKTFDSFLMGKGFQFTLGGGKVLKGWEAGIAGMKVGGKRRITCPPHMAFGGRGCPPLIPPNSTVVFEVELKAVH